MNTLTLHSGEIIFRQKDFLNFPGRKASAVPALMEYIRHKYPLEKEKTGLNKDFLKKS